ncbi:TetR/AcrR family transcriptional regulator [Amycolatopsis sp. NPDC023774]|uniref:TetR/AcrR family transcriptional regulator n=1 Tax=Amycolatopsis sp. NPDC023774 TaxID=3155015 RepID=UPI0033C32BB0
MRTEILDAAGRLLSELDGEDALTIRGVARAVGIAPASIYQHFADRTEIVHGLLEHKFERLQVLLEKADAQADPEDMIGRVRGWCTLRSSRRRWRVCWCGRSARLTSRLPGGRFGPCFAAGCFTSTVAEHLAGDSGTGRGTTGRSQGAGTLGDRCGRGAGPRTAISSAVIGSLLATLTVQVGQCPYPRPTGSGWRSPSRFPR